MAKCLFIDKLNLKKTNMKNVLKFLGIFIFTLFIVTACSDDDDPVDNDIFAGTYKGSVSYVSKGETVSNDNGSVFVTKLSGDTYNFKFSDNIPSLNGIKMKKGDNNTLILEDGALGGISISADKLNISYTKDGQFWSASATR